MRRRIRERGTVPISVIIDFHFSAGRRISTALGPLTRSRLGLKGSSSRESEEGRGRTTTSRDPNPECPDDATHATAPPLPPFVFVSKAFVGEGRKVRPCRLADYTSCYVYTAPHRLAAFAWFIVIYYILIFVVRAPKRPLWFAAVYRRCCRYRCFYSCWGRTR